MEESLIKKILPHSIEAEQSVIGSMILDSEAIVIASDIITGDDFYQGSYGMLFSAMIDLFSEGKAVDLVTLKNKLSEKNVPEEISSINFISQLISAVPTSANIREYAQIVKEKSVLRKLIRATDSIAAKCYLQKDGTDFIVEEAEKQIFDISQKRGVGELTPIKQVVINALDKIEAASKNRGNVTGISTGFYDLDYKTSGLQPSDLVLVAARPSMGKTAFALNIAQHVVLRSKVPTVIFSLEMSKEQLVNRMISLEAMVDAQVIRNGNLQGNEWEKLIEAAGEIGNSGLVIDDTPSISITELRSKCRKLKLEKNIGFVIIDYLQLMSGSGRSESRQQEISEISRSLKAIAREIGAPIMALSQVSRACESRPDHRPMLSDLRESGAIEQDADVVMFLYRDEYYNKDTEAKNQTEVIIAKQRNGPVGTVDLVWLGQYTKFANMAK